MSPKELIVFTDGACWGNGKKNPLAGIGIHFPNKEFKDISLPFTKNPTNQRAELFAIYLTLHLIHKKGLMNTHKITIYTDSMYSINCTTKWYKKWKKNGWTTSKGEAVINQTLIKAIVKYIEKYDIELIHVRSHTGKDDFESIHNDKADKLATKAVSKQRGGNENAKGKIKIVLVD